MLSFNKVKINMCTFGFLCATLGNFCTWLFEFFVLRQHYGTAFVYNLVSTPCFRSITERVDQPSADQFGKIFNPNCANHIKPHRIHNLWIWINFGVNLSLNWVRNISFIIENSGKTHWNHCFSTNRRLSLRPRFLKLSALCPDLLPCI